MTELVDNIKMGLYRNDTPSLYVSMYESGPRLVSIFLVGSEETRWCVKPCEHLVKMTSLPLMHEYVFRDNYGLTQPTCPEDRGTT